MNPLAKHGTLIAVYIPNNKLLCAMKTFRINSSLSEKFVGFVIVGMLLFLFAGNRTSQASPFAVSFQVFYEELSPYGDWVEDPHYGFIWIPYAERGFQPYRTNGHWVMSTYGNTWVSHYDWGWAPFHYGRWFFSDLYGWAWIPGYEWGPAWVNWRTGSGYYGWFPLGPRVSFYTSFRFPVYSHWVFVPRRRLLSRNLFRYYLPGRNVNVIYQQTTVINNTYVYNNQNYIAGPSRRELQQVTRRDVPVFQVREGRRPGRTAVSNNNIELYRPRIQPEQARSRNSQAQARPRNYIPSTEYRSRNAERVQPERRAIVPGSTPANTVRSETLKDGNIRDSRSARSNQAVSPARIGSDTGGTRGGATYTNRAVSPNRKEAPAADRSQPYARSRTTTVAPRSSTPSQPTVRSAPSQPRVNASRQPSTVQRNTRSAAPTIQRSRPAQGQVRTAKPENTTRMRSSAPASQNRTLRSAPATRSTRTYQNRGSSGTPRRVAPSTPRTQRSAPAASSQRSRRGN